jgi:hypothetical protein
LLERVRGSEIMVIIGGHELVSTNERIALNCDENAFGITPNDVVYIIFDRHAMPKYKSLITKGVSLALHVADLREFIYACNLDAKYVVANKEDAIVMQKAADNYMFDTKVLALIYEEEEIEWAALHEIDGVMFATEEME